MGNDIATPVKVLEQTDILDISTNDWRLSDHAEDEILSFEAKEVNGALLSNFFETIPPTASVEFRAGEIFVFEENSMLAHWHSKSAILADLGSTNYLREQLDGWDEQCVEFKARCLELIRGALTQCPKCMGKVEVIRDEPLTNRKQNFQFAVMCTACKSPLLVTY